jgi:hypothetical protein
MPPLWQYLFALRRQHGLMRAWLEILREPHPGTSWIAEETPRAEDPQTQARKETAELVPAA